MKRQLYPPVVIFSTLLVAILGVPVWEPPFRLIFSFPWGWTVDLSICAELEWRQSVRKWLQELDAGSYFVRQEARRQLEQMLSQPDVGPLVAEEIRRWLAEPTISVEVRHVLETFQQRFPKAFARPEPFSRALSERSSQSGEDKLPHFGENRSPSAAGGLAADRPPLPPPQKQPSQKEIEALVHQLESDSYAQRQWAAQQLRSYLERPEWAGLILGVFRNRLARGEISADLRCWLDPLWERAWGAWLASGAPSTDLPPARLEEIRHWVDILAYPAPNSFPERGRLVRQAQRQLRMLLARDDQVPVIREAIERRLQSGQLAPEAVGRLMELADLCRPAMAAEYWLQGQHRGIQHLLVGVPSQAPGAPRPSHFDYIDDQTAHCVSGSNLAPGEYPVGVAIPHPHQVDAFFHLVNLPTPRRRMAYEYLVQRDVRQRLAEITHRTCQYYLQRGKPLSVREILVLRQLEPKQVSRFASEFLRTIPDEPIEEAELQIIPRVAGEWEVLRLIGWEEGEIGRVSRHGLLCMLLAERGGKEAAPGLMEALAKDRLLPPTVQSPWAWGWIAALAIAARDPWPEVEQWLVSLVPRTDPLQIPPPGEIKRTVNPNPPQIGATAAGLLLLREGQGDLSTANLIMDKLLAPAEDSVLGRYKLPGLRFRHPKAPEEFLQWWKNKQVLRNSAG